MRTIKIVNVVLLLCVLFSCATIDPVANPVEAAKKTAAILSNAPDALEGVLESFKKADIVFIGSASHYLLNETLFTTENLQHFYDAGVRYILIEGGGGRKDDSALFSDEELQDIAIVLFYPWEYAGVRYKLRDWGDGDLRGLNYETYLINANKNDNDSIKSIGLEFGRPSFIPWTMDGWEELNYRDEYMANIAFSYIDNAAPGEKFLVLGGGQHGVTARIGPNSNPYVAKLLGVYLKEKYKERFVSCYYFTLDEAIKMNESYQDMFQSKEWQSIPNTPKFVTPKQALQLVELLSFEYNAPFDWYIVDKAGIKGITHSYALFDLDVLKEIIAQTRQYEADIGILSSEGRLNYEDADLYYNIRNLLMNVYYLRLFFGDYFPYDFWNPQMPLKDALFRLESVVLADGVNPQDFMRFPVPPIETLRDYHDNIEFFAALKNVEVMQESGSNTVSVIEKIFTRSEPYIQKARELFPYELWADYWYAKMYTAIDDYEKAYPYLQTLLGDPLLYSMQIYPEVLELVARSAEHLGNRERSVEYQALSDGLANEFGIDTSSFSLFLSSSY
jgi:hypothetical protein